MNGVNEQTPGERDAIAVQTSSTVVPGALSHYVYSYYYMATGKSSSHAMPCHPALDGTR